MLHIYYGDDRIKTQMAIRKMLGEDYEVVEAAELDLAGVRDVFLGTSLFGRRKIVVKDLSLNKEVWPEIINFVNTEHEVVVWEEKLDKRKTLYKDLVKAGVEMKEFKLAKPVDAGKVFDIYEVAQRDGVRAVKMCEEIENANDPYMFVGLLISQAIKKWNYRAGEKEKRALQELSKLDMQMKGESGITSPWTLVKSFLLRVSWWQ